MAISEAPAPPTCADDTCDNRPIKRGMCNKHYLRWWKATPPEQRRVPTKEEHFWAKVRKGPLCWEWTAARRPGGHGLFLGPDRTCIPAARFSLELHLGYPPPPGTEVCHRCDNPPCVNPRHLYYGTRQNNVDDAWARGLMPVGSQKSSAKLTEAQVLRIRERYAAGSDARPLADEYGIAVVTLRHIVLGLKWKHVAGPITRRRPKRAQTEKAA